MQILLRISRIIDAIVEWIGRLTSWLMLLMILIGVYNVFGRYLGRSIQQKLTSNAFLNIQSYLFDLIFLLGAAYVLKYDGHVRVDLFYKKWNRKQKALANLLGTFLFLIPFSTTILYYAWSPVIKSWQIWEISPNADALPLYPIKSVLIISFVLLIFQGISEAIKNLAILTDQLPPQEGDRHSGL